MLKNSSLVERLAYSALFILFFVIHTYATTRDYRFCNRLLPQSGRWVDYPPYWYPNNCPETRIFDQNATIGCMRGRTLYVIGNSIARQQAFALLELVGGTAMAREGQRDMCPKHETFWGDSCHSEFHDVKFKYLFLQFLDGYNYTDRGGFPFVDHSVYSNVLPNTPGEVLPMYWEDDNCIQMKTRDCLQNFFVNATNSDVLIFVGGMPYCGLGQPNPVLNRAWLQSSASAFRSHISAVFPGNVFRLNNAHVGKKYAQNQECVDEVNQILNELWFTGSESNPWYSIDQRAINEGRDHYYNDALHFVGPLTLASLTQVLNMLCPRLGAVDKQHAFLYIGSIIRNRMNVTEQYIVDPQGQLRVIPPTCIKVLVSSSVTYPDDVILEDRHLSSLLKGPAIEFNFCDKDRLYQLPNERSVYVLGDDNQLHSFQSGNDFLRRGYSFENVNKIDAWLMNYFRKGNPL